MNTKILKPLLEAQSAMPPRQEDILHAVEEMGQTLKDEALEREQFRRDSRARHEHIEQSIKALVTAIGQRPEADGTKGTGLLGSVAKLEKDVQSFLDLMNTGKGFILSLKIFGTLILGGIAYWITHLFQGTKS